jgi:hypothetical protein
LSLGVSDFAQALYSALEFFPNRYAALAHVPFWISTFVLYSKNEKVPKQRVRILRMDSSTTITAYPFMAYVPVAQAARGETQRRRRSISPEAGRALEILGHAIEYLADEFAHAGGSLSAHDGQIEAMQLLMAMNRQVYFACPEVLTIGERLRALLGWRTA